MKPSDKEFKLRKLEAGAWFRFSPNEIRMNESHKRARWKVVLRDGLVRCKSEHGDLVYWEGGRLVSRCDAPAFEPVGKAGV